MLSSVLLSPGLLHSPQIVRTGDSQKRGFGEEDLPPVQKLAEVKRLHGLGLSPEQALEQSDFGELESWRLYQSQAPIAMQKVYEELEGKPK